MILFFQSRDMFFNLCNLCVQCAESPTNNMKKKNRFYFKNEVSCFLRILFFNCTCKMFKHGALIA